MPRCYACCQENCGYQRCTCDCHDRPSPFGRDAPVRELSADDVRLLALDVRLLALYETCPSHPRYQAKRKPRSACEICWRMWAKTKVKWTNPLNLHLIPTVDSDFHNWIAPGQTVLPLPGHVGAFGHIRKNHIHEGVDLYCPDGTMVFAVEPGIVVAIQDFTGERANPPSPWWENTMAVLVEGESGVVVYGEIQPVALEVGRELRRGEQIGCVTKVLKKDKGRPMSMLHLELHQPGTRDTYEWPVDGPRPISLLDPTEKLLQLSNV